MTTSSSFLGTSSSFPPDTLWCLMRWFLVNSRLLSQHPHRSCTRSSVNPLPVTCFSGQTRTTRHLPATRVSPQPKLLRLTILTEHGPPLALGLPRPNIPGNHNHIHGLSVPCFNLVCPKRGVLGWATHSLKSAWSSMSGTHQGGPCLPLPAYGDLIIRQSAHR